MAKRKKEPAYSKAEISKIAKVFESQTQAVKELPDNEKERLLAKDIHTIRHLLGLQRDIVAALRAGTFTRAQLLLFVRVYQIFQWMELTLWELKRLGRGFPRDPPIPPEPWPPELPEPEEPSLPTPPK